jgi:ribosomal protein S27AE
MFKMNGESSPAVRISDLLNSCFAGGRLRRRAMDGLTLSRQITAAAQERNVQLFQGAVAGAVSAKEAVKLERRIEVKLSACPRCSDGIIFTALHSGRADKSKVEKLDTKNVDAGFVRSLPPAGKPGGPPSA